MIPRKVILCDPVRVDAEGRARGAGTAFLPNVISNIFLVFGEKQEKPDRGVKAGLVSGLAPLDLRLYINLDVIGANLFIGLEEQTFAIGAESGGSGLQEDLDAALGESMLTTQVFSTAMGHGRSDHEALRQIVPFVFLSDGTGPSYHTAADEIHTVNLDKVVETAGTVAALARRALARPSGYPRLPVDPELPLFADAQPLREGLALGRLRADANGLDGETRFSLDGCLTVLDGILARGPEACTIPDRMWIGLVALRLLDISANLPFIPPP